MPLGSGTRLGPYEILGPLGAGGMGEVYRAKDQRLDRTVAIKILPPHLADNPELRQRFEREARAVSSLNHPNICVLHDIGQQDGVDFLVMEYLDGETLAARLAKGPLATEALLQYAGQIAQALAQAHRQGVFHRDLKPGNIMLTRTGAKLLDFGLAKVGPAAATPGQGISLSVLPTQVLDVTQKGAIMGTFQYMAPEQLQGHDADARSDIFAFGAVLYEMATGRKAFDGKSVASVIAAVVDSEPQPISSLQPTSPPLLDQIVRKCLEKDPEKRWQSVLDVASALEWAAAAPAPPPAKAAATRIPWMVAGAAALVAVVLGVFHFREAPGVTHPTRFTIDAPQKGQFFQTPAVSPDGRFITSMVVTQGGGRQLALRALDSLATQMIAGTEGGTSPFWSPDSRFIAFFADGKLKKIDIAGGPPQVLCDSQAFAGAWSRLGLLIFSGSSALARVAAAGGVPAALPAQTGEVRVSPQFLRDGHHYLFWMPGSREGDAVYVGSIDSPEKNLLVASRYQAIFTPATQNSENGYLLFLRERTLMAQPFDAGRRTLSGDPFPLADTIPGSPTGGGAAFSAADNGTLVYRTGSGVTRQLLWFDREGRSQPIGNISSSSDLGLSPDDARVAMSETEGQGASDIWLLDWARNIRSRFTFHASADSHPVWSPDGSRIVFASARDGPLNLYVKPANGAGNEELLLKSDLPKYPSDWSRDGGYLVYASLDPKTKADLWILRDPGATGEHIPQPFLRSEFNESHGQISPDGKYLAYQSDETGRFEIYVRPFPSGTSGKWQVSSSGGGSPRWRHDGKELFYLAPDRRLMAVEVTTGAAFGSKMPKPLFETRIFGSYASAGFFLWRYAVAADGKRFVVLSTGESSATPIIVVLNWAAGRRP